MPKKKLIIFMGTPGTNNIELAHYLKTHRYRDAIIIDRYDSWLRHSKQSYDSLIVEHDLYTQVEMALYKANIVIVVAPFVLKTDRDNFFNFIENKFSLNIIGVWVERKYEDLKTLRQLRLSYRQVSNEIFEYLYHYRESPKEDEPFNDIVYITREVNTGISKSRPYIVDILTALDQI